MTTVETFGKLTEVDRPHFGDQLDVWVDEPDDLPFDEASCQNPAGCASDPAAPVGWTLHEDDDEPWRSGAIWHTTFRSETGLYLCEDCALWVEEGCPKWS